MNSRTIAAILALAASATMLPAHASLLGQTFDADITISGTDDDGFYTIPVIDGPITVPGSGTLSVTVPVFKQLTFMGFHSVSNQIDGSVVLEVSSNAISVTMLGQVQPFELESIFTGIGGTIVDAVDSATGVIPGVNMDLFSSFAADSLDFASYYLGYQTGTNLKQTQTLTFAAVEPAPEPATLALLALACAGIGLARRGRIR